MSRSLALPPEADERLNRLCEAANLNRNALVKLLAMTLAPSDVEALRRRLGD